MATRQVVISIEGQSGNYEATVQRIIEKNNQFARAAQQGAQQTTSAFGGLERILINFPSLFSGIGKSIASAFSAGAIIAFGKSIIDVAGQIDDLSKRTGFARQTLSGIKSAIEENGGTLEGFANAINKAQKSLGDIDGDGRKAADAFKAMGLNVDQLVKASPEQFFEQFAKSLSEVENQNSRVTIATRVFSKAGAEQIPIILELADKFADLRKRGISDENIKTLDEFGDSITRLSNQLKILAAGEIAEGLRDLQKTLSVIAQTFNQLIPKELLGNFGGFNAMLRSTQKEILFLYEGLLRLKLAFADSTSVGGKNFVFDIAGMKKAIEDVQRTRETLGRRTFEEGLAGAEGRSANSGRPLNIVDSEKAEAASKKAAEEALKNAQAVAQLRKEIDQTQVSILQASEGTERYSQAQRDAAIAVLGAEQAEKIAAATKDGTIKATSAYIDKLFEQKRALLEVNEAQKATARYIEAANRALEDEAEDQKTVAEARAFGLAFLDRQNQAAIKAIDTTKQISDLEADRLSIIGRTTDAERLRIENQIKYLRALKEQEGVDSKNAVLRDAQIQNEEQRLQQLGTVTISVGQTIADSVGGAFSGVILGTRKLAEVGKGFLAALLGDIGQFFTQALVKKVGFESLVFNNANGFLAQLSGLFGLATSSGGSGTGGGGIFSTLISGIGKVLSLFGGSSGGAGLFGSFPAASEISDLTGFTFSSFGGGASSLGGFGSGIVSNVISGVSNLWNAFTSTSFGASIGASISSTLGSTITAAIETLSTSVAAVVSTISTTLSTVLTTISSYTSWIPYIGWAIAAITVIYRIIANQQERPNAKFSGQFQGVSFDETSKQFVPGDINVIIGRKSGIKNSQAGAIADNLQERLKILAIQWTDILNIFPDFIEKDMQPALDETNRRLNKNFKDLKFSPGGSRDIQQELESLSGYAGLFRFFQAFAPSIEQGFRSSLQGGGIQIGSAAGFANLDPNKGFKWGAPQEDWDKFIAAIKDVAGLTSQLGSVGAGKFLTGSDLTNIGGLFDQLFSVTDSSTFVKAAAELKDKLKPALDFLTQSVQESTDLFGRGLMAALEAATESDAIKAFTESLGAGVKDAIFNGIIQSFVASAQFGDLLAPIQQQIREFTQKALASGETPDIAAFRRAILPAIEAIASRAGILAPLIAELQKLGLDITDSITSLFGPDKLKPVDEFLQASIKSATDLFQRGLIAALDAATSSQANEAFLQSLGAGVKDILFKGITDAFIASAQFDELLLPIQKTIQAFTAEATASGRTPDLAAFRAAILPQIGDLSARAATLAPLIAALQELGFSFKDALKVFDPATQAVPKVEINIENFNRDDDPAALARQIQNLLGGRLAPAA